MASITFPDNLLPFTENVREVELMAVNYRELVEKLHARPADIEDTDVAALVEAGWSEDRVFELVVSGSVKAGRRTLEAGLAALRDGVE